MKNHVWVFINALIENPTFDSQTKENMTLQAKSFGSHCSLSEKFINSVCGLSLLSFSVLLSVNKYRNVKNNCCRCVLYGAVERLMIRVHACN